MIKFTEKQLDKIQNLIQGETDLFELDSRVYNKLNKFGFIGFSEDEPEHTNEFCRIKWDHIGYYRYEFLTQEALDYFAEIGIAKAVKNNRCWKCDGKGYIQEYGYVQGGVCFECNGTGKNK